MLSEVEYNELSNCVSHRHFMEVLHKQSPNIAVKRISGERLDEEIDISSLNVPEEFKPLIEEFLTKFNKMFGKCNNNALITNLKSLSIKVVDKLPEEIARGMYQTSTNTIYIKSSLKGKELKAAFFHEMVHMSSTYKKGDLILSGFHQNYGEIFGGGFGLNEGATELITQLAFLRDDFELSTYFEEFNIAYLIRDLVGGDIFFESYLSGDLNKIVGEIAKYIDVRDAFLLIANIDQLNTYFKKGDVNLYTANAARLKALFARIRVVSAFKGDNFVKSFYDIEETKLSASLGARGYILSKNKNGDYVFRINTDTRLMKISNEVYYLLYKYFISTSEYKHGTSDKDIFNKYLVDLLFALCDLEYDGVDLSTVESVSVLNAKTRDYHVTYKSTVRR